jgi:hypothetical protein
MRRTERMVEYMTWWYDGWDQVVEWHWITLSILRLNFPYVMTQYDATVNSPTKLSFCPFNKHDSIEVDRVAVFTV